MLKLRSYCLILLLVLLPGLLLAASSPLTMLQNTANQMIEELKKNKASLQQDPLSVYSIVKRILLPHIDQETMARSVLDRETWQKASPQERKKFMDEYTFLLVRTYSRALASYNDQEIRFLPIRGGVEGQRLVQVNSLILQKNGPSIPIDYRVRLAGNEWKVYDISVDSVSMVQSYKVQFAEKLAENGITGLISSIQQLNKSQK
jgi:phospholipid transport system substrate-binding protein